MKLKSTDHYPILLKTVLLLLLAGQFCWNADAQYVTYPQLRQNAPELIPEHSQWFAPNMDTDLALIRANAFPDLQFHVDDYLAYSPAAALFILKACGYESRSSWGRMLASDAFSASFMVLGTSALKYTVRRNRPDGSERTSFPSGHAAKAFMMATLLHKEYGGRSPWFSIGAYSVASLTAVMRLMNNKHWFSDTFAGALIGIGSAELGYFVADKIFKENHLQPGYAHPEFFYDSTLRQYDVDLQFYRRFVCGSPEDKEKGLLPQRGSGLHLNVTVPVAVLSSPRHPALASQAGLMLRTGIGSLVNRNVSNVLAGGFWKAGLNDRYQADVHLMTGYAHISHPGLDNLDLLAGTSLSLSLTSCFKLKAFAEYECLCSFSAESPLHSFLLGFGAGFYW